VLVGTMCRNIDSFPNKMVGGKVFYPGFLKFAW
jgi:hypothetical protein